MDTTLLNVPYVSQKAPGSMGHYNDCGAACMSITLKTFSHAMKLPCSFKRYVWESGKYLCRVWKRAITICL